MTNASIGQFDLFSDEENIGTGPSSRTQINVALSGRSSTKLLTKTQNKFNSLMRQIETEKASLLEWQQTLPRYHQSVAADYEPLLAQYNEMRAGIVHRFDQVFGDKLFKKTDKTKLSYLITNLSADLIEQGREDMIDIHDRYAGYSYLEAEQEENELFGQALKSMMETAFNMELEPDLDLTSPEQAAQFAEKMRQKEAERQRQAEEKRARRKKTAKQLEKEAKQQQEEKSVSLSIREAYRKLSSLLHPDREQDADERVRKTELMQRVNAAYAKKDLLKLLELQLEVEQIDPDYIDNLAEDRLININNVLQEQLKELREEILIKTAPLRMQLNLPPYMPLSPKGLMLKLNSDIKVLKKQLQEIKDDLASFENKSVIKEFLKSYRIPKQNNLAGFDGLDEIESLLAGLR